MRRRDFMLGTLGLSGLSPLSARGQRTENAVIGYLTGVANDSIGQSRLSATRQGLEALGWREGSNTTLHVRWGSGDVNAMRAHAANLVSLNPHVILAETATALAAAHQSTKSIPIVFTSVSDPVGNGFVESLARPSQNVTGFSLYEYSMLGKWMVLIKELAPRVGSIALLQNAQSPNWTHWHASAQSTSRSMGVNYIETRISTGDDVRSEIERVARQSNSAIVALPDPFMSPYRSQIVQLSKSLKLPMIYAFRYWVTDGGLIAYGVDQADLNRRSAYYVDRLLRGEKVANLPVQQPLKYELSLNLKTAKELGLAVPQSLLTRADEVIE